MNKEIRTATLPFTRSEGDNCVKIQGYAAVFDEVTDIGGIFNEVIRKGAFSSALERNDDVVLLIDHIGLPLARTRSNTLKLSEDEKGLFIEAELDLSDPDVSRIVPKMNRGDLDKMSFAFSIAEGGQRWVESQNGDLREITDTFLHDVSVVTFPAYEGTEAALRSRDNAKERSEKEKLEAQKKADNYFLRKAKSENKFRKI